MDSHTPENDPMLVKCPYCPVCGSEPLSFMLGMYQWFCPNQDCDVLMWVPWETAAHNLAREYKIDWPAPVQDVQPAYDHAVPCLYDDDEMCTHIVCQDMDSNQTAE